MKAKTLDLLIHIMDDIINENQTYDSHRPLLAKALKEAGINRDEVLSTLNWLDSIIEGPITVWETSTEQKINGERIYTLSENNKIPLKGVRFLKELEHTSIINTITRERIIDSAMACDADEISFEQLQWIAYMVLANHLDDHVDFELLDTIFDCANHHTISKH